jgi:hypothetical protein
MRQRVCAAALVCTAGWASGPTASAAQGIGVAGTARVGESYQLSARPGDSSIVRAVNLDGRLTEPLWRSETRADAFVQQRPDPGQRASQPTEARVWLNGMRLFDSAPDSIVAPYARRDADVYSDWAVVMIDSYHDRRTAFHFAVNPSGVQRDAQITNDEEWAQDFDWNAVWHAETGRDSLGWTVEFRIPLSQLRFAASSGAGRWGIQFGRHLARRNERSYWSPVLPDRSGFVSQFGELTDVTVRDAPRRLEIVPYSLAQVTTRAVDARDPFARAREPRAALGADLKWGITPDFTLTATLNPDFGQVESDPSEVNLTAQESFFREQRPFFLEGAEMFQFNMSTSGWMFGPQQLFYSRRIGRAPQGGMPGGAEYSARPPVTDLLGALKLTGKTSSGWSAGLLTATTAEMRADAAFADGAHERPVVEPLTQYTMGRLQKDFNAGQSFVGAVGTSVWRDESVALLRQSAIVGGADFRHRFAGRRYQVAGYVLGSRVRGTAEAITATQRSSVHVFQRPDAEHLRVDSTLRVLDGYAAELRVGKVGGAWRWAGAAHLVSPGFEANDLGFHGRSDVLETSGWFGRQFFDGPPGVRNWDLWLNAWGSWTLGGERERVGHNVYTRAEFTNYWEFEGALEHHVHGYSIPALRGGPALFTPRRLAGFGRLSTDGRKPTVYQLMFGGGRDLLERGSSLRMSPQVTHRFADRALLTLAPSLSWWHNPQQYVAAQSARYVVGDISQTTAALVARLDYSLTPRLSLQFYAQPFLTAGVYDRIGEVVDARSSDPSRRVRRFDPGNVTFADGRMRLTSPQGTLSIAHPDFAFNELRSNTVLRWEYRPGSTLFLVWSHGRSAAGMAEPFDLGRQARELADVQGEHVLLLKVSHYLGR